MEKYLDGVSKKDFTCDARNKCFYIIDTSGSLYNIYYHGGADNTVHALVFGSDIAGF